MIRKVSIIIIVFSLLGCFREKVRIRKGIRVTVSGSVVDQQDVALENIPVRTFGNLDTFYIREISKSNLFGEIETDKAGEFKFVSLDNKNSFFTVAINPQESKFYNPDYNSVYLMDTIDDHGTYISLNDLNLKNTTPVSLQLINTQVGSEIFYEIDTESSTELFLIQDHTAGEPLILENFELENELKGRLNDENSEKLIVFSYVEGSEIKIKYRIDEGEIQETVLNPGSESTIRFEF